MKTGKIQFVNEKSQEHRPQKTRKKKFIPLIFLIIILSVIGMVTIRALFPATNIASADIQKNPVSVSKDLIAQQEVIQSRVENERNKSSLISDKVFNLVGKDNENGAGSNILNFLKSNLSQSFSAELITDGSDEETESPIDFESVSETINDRIQHTIPIQSNPGNSGDGSTGIENQANPGKSTMFIYSRSFKKAKYYDKKASGTAKTKKNIPAAESIEESLYKKMGIAGPVEKKKEEPKESPITTIIYNNFPVVRIFEGDFTEGVLINQLVADSQESPVIIGITKNLYDRHGQYIIFPTNTRFIGYSQIIRSQGASRLFIGMKKIILPNNVVINIPPAKRLLGLENDGSLGIRGKVKGHFLKKFGSSLFVGILNGLGGMAQNRINRYSGWGNAISQSSENFSEISSQMIQQNLNIVPTIQIQAGHRIKIFFTSDYIITPYRSIQYP